MTFAVFHDLPGLENGSPKFHDYPWLVGTLPKNQHLKLQLQLSIFMQQN